MSDEKLRILVISAHYPPDHSGGYELRIKDIMDGLAARGHEICVLTTKPRRKTRKLDDNTPYPVVRKLHNRYSARFFPKEVWFDLLDSAAVERQIKRFQPDVIYLGHVYVLSKAILPYLARTDLPIVLDEGGASLKGAWTERGRWFRFTGDYKNQFEILNKIKPILISLVEKMSKRRIQRTFTWPSSLTVIFNNERNATNVLSMGIPIRKHFVVHSGVDMEKFFCRRHQKREIPIKVIYPGRIEALKGQLDAVNLSRQLKEWGINAEITLIGPGNSAEYLEKILTLILDHQLSDRVKILPMVPQDQLIKHYCDSDYCFFPTYHRMGFSRTPLEAMACGCVVISYGNEGSAEVIENGESGFLVQEGDLAGAAEIVRELVRDPEQMARILGNARRLVEENHSLPRYVDRVEQVLIDTIH